MTATRPGGQAGNRPPGIRVVLDARPLQDPARAPATARYLDRLLGAFDADPLAGESFAFLLQSDLDDPTDAFTRLDVVGRRLLPPTRLLRSGALTVDPFLLRGASLGAAWRADRSGAAGAVYHAVAGSPPMFSRIPIVVTLLDLAPWELPETFQRSTASRFGQRLRGRLVRDAAAVIVGSEAVARSARRLLRLRAGRVRVVPMAPHPGVPGDRRDDMGRGPRGAGLRRRRRPDGQARAAGAVPRVLRPVRRAPRRGHVPARPREPGLEPSSAGHPGDGVAATGPDRGCLAR